MPVSLLLGLLRLPKSTYMPLGSGRALRLLGEIKTGCILRKTAYPEKLGRSKMIRAVVGRGIGTPRSSCSGPIRRNRKHETSRRRVTYDLEKDPLVCSNRLRNRFCRTLRNDFKFIESCKSVDINKIGRVRTGVKNDQ